MSTPVPMTTHEINGDPGSAALERLRAICLAYPEAVEAGGVGLPTFKVREKIFAMRHPHAERWSLWCKAPPGMQQVLVDGDPQRCFVPPYVGRHGWVGVFLDDAAEPDWEQIANLIDESYRRTVPKRLLQQLDADA